MSRRSFFKKLGLLGLGLAILPTVVNSLPEPKNVIRLEFNGKEYWIDWEQYLAEKKWYEEQELKMWKYHRPFLREYK